MLECCLQINLAAKIKLGWSHWREAVQSFHSLAVKRVKDSSCDTCIICYYWRATRQIHRVVSSCCATQSETKWQAPGRRAKKYGPATIREAQIAVSEVLGGDYALRALSSISWLLERRASNRSATIFIFFFLEITWFCIPLWFRYHVWICCNASPPCVINTKIFSHVWNW